MKYLCNFPVGKKLMRFPLFCPDATRGVIRSLDSRDVAMTGIEGVIVNTYHLMSEPGTTVIKQAGGIKKFMNWQGWVISDSGGWQLASLIHRKIGYGTISDKGVVFHKSSTGKKDKLIFTPEKSIQVQLALGSDILICLDDCPALKAKEEEVETAVKRTVEWAKRCKEEFEKNQRGQLLLAVIQGGNNKKLREQCAQELLNIGFDGYGFGGWPLDEEGRTNNEILKFTAELMPSDRPKYALGVGNLQAVRDGTLMGYNIFDTVLPTRDARHQRLYLYHQGQFGFLDIGKEKNTRDFRPIEEDCDCHTCQNYPRAYLHHLFEIGDYSAGRLATIHNLRVYARLIQELRR